MSRAAAPVQALAALVLGLAAGYALADPSSDLAVIAFDGTQIEGLGGGVWGGWATVLVAAPGFAAVIAAATVVSAPSRRLAWRLAALAMLGVLVAQAPVAVTVEWQTTQRYAVAGLAGLALGAAAAATWGRRWAQPCLLLGALLAFLLSGQALVWFTDQMPRRYAYLEQAGQDFRLARLWWIFVLAAVLALAAAWNSGADRVWAEAGPSGNWRSVAAAVTLAVGAAASHAVAEPVPAVADAEGWASMAGGLLLALAAYGAAALILPARGGVFLLAVLATTAAAAQIVLDESVYGLLGPAAVAVAAGLGVVVGAWWRAPLIGFGALGVLALLAIPEFGVEGRAAPIRLLALALAAGFTLAASSPASATSGGVGVTALFVLAAPVTLAVPRWFAYTPLTDSTTMPGLSAAEVAVALALTIAAAGLGAGVLSRRRR